MMGDYELNLNTMSLTEQKIRNAKPKDKIYYLTDQDGLSLKVDVNGAKSWSYRYQVQSTNKRTRIKLGQYPNVSLKEARTLRNAKKLAHQQLLDQAQFNQKTFKDIAEEWLIFKRKNALNDEPRCGVIQLTNICFQRDILPILGHLIFHEVRRFNLVQVVRHIESRQVKEPVKKACSYLNQLYDYAVGMGYCELNIATGLDRVLLTKKIKQHYPYLKTEQELTQFMCRLEQSQAHPIIKKALWLKLYTGVRGIEVLSAEAQHFDFENKIWKIPAKYVKQFRRKVILGFDIPDYVVPLSTQALDTVKSALEWSCGDTFVFASPKKKDQALHFNTLNYTIRRMGYSKEELSSHGLRSTLSTILNESGLFHPSWIEAQLSHTDKDKTRATYNHADYIDARHKMMQWWADRLDQLRFQVAV